MRTWISDTNTTEWRAFVPSKFYTGERYYLWYKIYDPSTGLTLDEAYPGQSYTVTLEWYDYRGELVESVDYHNSLNWFGVQAKYAEQYSCRITVSGAGSGVMTQSFTPESSFTMQTDASSSKRSAGDKFTEAVSFSGETTGIAIAIDTSNYDVISINGGRESNHQILIDLAARKPGNATITVKARKTYGDCETVDTVTLNYSVDAGPVVSVFPYYPSDAEITDIVPTISVMGTGDVGMGFAPPKEEITYSEAKDDIDLATGLNTGGSAANAVSARFDQNLRDDETSFEARYLQANSEENGKTAPAEEKNTAAKTAFSDVKESDWFYRDVQYVQEQGLMGGTGKYSFSPNASVTRGMVLTILARCEGVDTTGSPWYARGCSWAVENGISDGTNPEKAVTREQLATMLYRYAQYRNMETPPDGALGSFTDSGAVSAYAVQAMQWAVGAKLLQGSGAQLMPKGTASRAQFAAILHRFLQ